MTLSVIDSHCHLEPADFGAERDQVIARARAAGVVHFIAIGSGSSLANVDNAVALTVAHGDFSTAIGIHPHDVARMGDDALATIERLAVENPKVVAIGETGLDYHYLHSPQEVQKLAFRRFIEIAKKAGKPLTLHIRDAHADAREIFAAEGGREVGAIVHCFTGTVGDARAWLDLGCALSFSGILTFKSAEEIRRAAAFAPADKILVETDCPFLAPIPWRGKRNEPAYIVETLKVLAAVRAVSVEECAEATVSATRAAFRLGAR